MRGLISTILKSPRNHAVIVEGPAGWGKTTAVDLALAEAVVEGVHLGAYSTPLNLFNFLFLHSSRFVVVDDCCAGLFSDSSWMAILKAATWPRSTGQRILKWGSTSGKAAADEFDFTGKLVIVCNSFPSTPGGDAVRSRAHGMRIDVSCERAMKLLRQAAADRGRFADPIVAKEAVEWVCERLSPATLASVSYRTLENAYELAIHNPVNWRDLIGIGSSSKVSNDPKRLVADLATQPIKVKDQFRMFTDATGYGRRTFFKLRRETNVGGR